MLYIVGSKVWSEPANFSLILFPQFHLILIFLFIKLLTLLLVSFVVYLLVCLIAYVVKYCCSAFMSGSCLDLLLLPLIHSVWLNSDCDYAKSYFEQRVLIGLYFFFFEKYVYKWSLVIWVLVFLHDWSRCNNQVQSCCTMFWMGW